MCNWKFKGVYGKLPCNERKFGDIRCPKCKGIAYSHRYDACHLPWLVYAYEYHCHNCGVWFEDQDVIDDMQQYIREIREKYSERMV